MAWVVPAGIAAASFVKSLIDSDNAKSQDRAMAAAGAEKIRMMREGAGDLERYRAQLPPQLMAAMQQQMGAYGGAQNVLQQMYGGGGGGAGGPMGGLMGPAGAQARVPGLNERRSFQTVPLDMSGSRMSPGMAQGGIRPPDPGQVMAGRVPMGFRMGFGGESPIPMPASLLRRM